MRIDCPSHISDRDDVDDYSSAAVSRRGHAAAGSSGFLGGISAELAGVQDRGVSNASRDLLTAVTQSRQ